MPSEGYIARGAPGKIATSGGRICDACGGCVTPTCSSCAPCCFHKDSTMLLSGATASGADETAEAASQWNASDKTLPYAPFVRMGCGDYSRTFPTYTSGGDTYRLIVFVNIQSVSPGTPIETGTPTSKAIVQKLIAGTWTDHATLWDSTGTADLLQTCCRALFPNVAGGIIATIGGNACCRGESGCTDAEGNPDCAGNCFWDCSNHAQCCVSKFAWLSVAISGDITVSYTGSDAEVAAGVAALNALDKSKIGNSLSEFTWRTVSPWVTVGSYEVRAVLWGWLNSFSGAPFGTVAPFWQGDIYRRAAGGTGDGTVLRTVIGATMNSAGGPVTGSCCGGSCPIYLIAGAFDTDFAWADAEGIYSNAHRSEHRIVNNNCCATPDGESVTCGQSAGRCADTLTLESDGWCPCACLIPPGLPSTVDVAWWDYSGEEPVLQTQTLTLDTEAVTYAGTSLALVWEPERGFCGAWVLYHDSGSGLVEVGTLGGTDCISPTGSYGEYEVTE